MGFSEFGMHSTSRVTYPGQLVRCGGGGLVSHDGRSNGSCRRVCPGAFLGLDPSKSCDNEMIHFILLRVNAEKQRDYLLFNLGRILFNVRQSLFPSRLGLHFHSGIGDRVLQTRVRVRRTLICRVPGQLQICTSHSNRLLFHPKQVIASCNGGIWTGATTVKIPV
jgi:hypothetical protein